MKIAFAITSRNYLAQTKIAIDSFLLCNPEFEVFVFNIDNKKYETIAIWGNSKINHHFIDDITFEHKQELRSRYNDFEFCNSIKPFLCHWLFEQFEKATTILYIDSDLVFFNKIELEDELVDYSIIITPHSLSGFPIDNRSTSELDILNSGIYNAGFFIVSNSSNGMKFLDWWKTRTLTYCYVDFEKGMFVDQIWLNLVPLYFDGVLVLKNLGYNVAHWNLHERTLSKQDTWKINDKFKLVFFHFSGFAFDDVTKISKHQDRFTLDSRNDLTAIFIEYKNNVEKATESIDKLLGKTSKSILWLRKRALKIQKWKVKINKIIKILSN